ncbi:hypothetical protein F3087_03975 [Nocardia colli]|uniref:Uncharacterized protein n=1 Tax=Nocardia colli TaxID=2545717 RepID=A0A5N0EN99_9NOCA|nr:hypothetical protein [Nocardia colli]KAA8890453.1 hypothetical protein F3087_03975 [Nocardia colli]
MTITVLDSYTEMRATLNSPLAERPELLRRMLEPTAGMFRYFPGKPDRNSLAKFPNGSAAPSPLAGTPG